MALGFLSASGVLVGVRGPGLEVQGPKLWVRVRALGPAWPPRGCALGQGLRPGPSRAPGRRPGCENKGGESGCCSGCGCPSFAQKDVVF